MRIALVHPFTWPRTRRGGERYLHDLGWYLEQAGHDVVIRSGRDRDTPATEVIDGCRVERCWDRPGRWLNRAPSAMSERVEVRRIAAQLGDDVDIVHSFWPQAARAAAERDHVVLYTLLGMPKVETAGPGTPMHRTLLGGARVATLSAALSEDSMAHAIELFGGPWTVLPPGLRLDRFPVRAEPMSGPTRFLFSAALSVRYKGLDMLLAAFARVLERHPDAVLRLSGQGSPEWALDLLGAEDRTRVEPRIERLGTGALDEADSQYAASTVTVLPSQNEAFGLSVVESLAAGTPVVACDHGGPAEILDAPGVGVTVPPGSAEALANAMCRAVQLARDPDTVQRCADRATRWDWLTSVGPVHERVYEALRVGDIDTAMAVRV